MNNKIPREHCLINIPLRLWDQLKLWHTSLSATLSFLLSTHRIYIINQRQAGNSDVLNSLWLPVFPCYRIGRDRIYPHVCFMWCHYNSQRYCKSDTELGTTEHYDACACRVRIIIQPGWYGNIPRIALWTLTKRCICSLYLIVVKQCYTIKSFKSSIATFVLLRHMSWTNGNARDCLKDVSFSAHGHWLATDNVVIKRMLPNYVFDKMSNNFPLNHLLGQLCYSSENGRGVLNATTITGIHIGKNGEGVITTNSVVFLHFMYHTEQFTTHSV